MARPAPAAGELLHQLLDLSVLLDQPVDVRRAGPGAGGDPSPARPVDDRGIASLTRRHRPDDRLDPLQIAAVDRLLGLLRHAAHARDHPHELAHRAHLLDLLDLLEEVLEGELRLAQLLLHLRRLLLVDVLLGPLDERHHVAHAEDPAGEAVRMEDLERVGLLAGPHELDGEAGHGADREGRATAGVAVDLR